MSKVLFRLTIDTDDVHDGPTFERTMEIEPPFFLGVRFQLYVGDAAVDFVLDESNVDRSEPDFFLIIATILSDGSDGYEINRFVLKNAESDPKWVREADRDDVSEDPEIAERDRQMWADEESGEATRAMERYHELERRSWSPRQELDLSHAF